MLQINKTKDLHYFVNEKDQKNSANIVLDIGLNNGSFSKEILKYFNNQVTVYGVEANKKVINYDLAIISDNYLISNKSKIKEKLFINELDSGSSSAIFKEDSNNYIFVESITIKDYINKHNLTKDPIFLIKIDIEGKEFEILDEDTISFFSSRDFKGKWYPATENSKVFRPLIECSCFLKNYCENKCINLINKKDVWRYMDEFYLNNLESNL